MPEGRASGVRVSEESPLLDADVLDSPCGVSSLVEKRQQAALKSCLLGFEIGS